MTGNSQFRPNNTHTCWQINPWHIGLYGEHRSEKQCVGISVDLCDYVICDVVIVVYLLAQ